MIAPPPELDGVLTRIEALQILAIASMSALVGTLAGLIVTLRSVGATMRELVQIFRPGAMPPVPASWFEAKQGPAK